MRPLIIASALCLAASCGTGSSGDANNALGGPEGGVPDAAPALVDPAVLCQQLVDSVCGAGLDASVCSDSIECEAARLTKEHEPLSCEEKRSRPDRYPPCELRPKPIVDTSCPDLVDKCCGIPELCGEEPGCQAAKDIRDEENVAACHQALNDETAFPRCVP